MMLGRLGVVGEPVSLDHPSVIDTGFGVTADCATFSGWLFNSGCWKHSQTAWEQMNEFPANLPMPTPPPSIPLKANGQPDCATQSCVDEINAALTQGTQASQDNALAWFQAHDPNVPPDCGWGSTPQLQSDGVNWKCSGIFGGSTSMVVIAAVAAVAVFGFIQLRK